MVRWYEINARHILRGLSNGASMAESALSIQYRDILVVGGSAGSLGPLREIMRDIPPDSRLSVFVALHLAVTERPTSALLEGYTGLCVEVASDGSVYRPGVVYISPANQHLVLAEGKMHVFRGPRENGARPSIDALFRSAAVHARSRVVAVLLSGRLFDGSAGVRAVQRCGGVGIVQDPSDALESELPRSALAEARVEHCLPARDIAKKVLELSAEVAPPVPSVPDDLVVEARLALASAERSEETIPHGQVAHLTCPDCDGPLWRIQRGVESRYHCEVGHVYNAPTLVFQQSRRLERALWVALRTLEERRRLLTSMSQDARQRGKGMTADSYAERLAELEEHVDSLRRALSKTAYSGGEEEL
jgi:two-component system chemotaxis response regulator CheB